MASATDGARRRRRLSSAWAWPLCGALALAAALSVQARFDQPGLAALAGSLPLLAGWAWQQRERSRARAMFRALAGTVASYRDGDFGFGLNWPHDDAIGDLVDAHNALAGVLREQRIGLVQRELLLDTVVQHTPVALVLVDPHGRVVLGNLAARRMLGGGRRLEGRAMATILDGCPPSLRDALSGGSESLVALGEDDDEAAVVHVVHRGLRLNGRAHVLILLRELTTELRRREVQTWKKVIRVISHELNNALAPIASLAHSGARMLQAGRPEQASEAFAIIDERSRHLEEFIRGYARFAKLPAPRREPLDWGRFLATLQRQVGFAFAPAPADAVVHADAAQLEQALLNLLKNAHEAGGAAGEVRIELHRQQHGWRIDVVDRGGGMTEAVMTQALLPFYSTKRGGTGLGLALAREIAEAHGGSVQLSLREGGGMRVSLLLPDP